MKSKILIVEDEARIARFLQLELEHEGYSVLTRPDGASGLDAALRESVDLVLLDLMLPEISGIEVLKGIKAVKSVPVIVLTARDKVMDKVMGLDVGADDYMTKPFAIEELLARMRNLLKRGDGGSRVVTIGDLSIDTNKQQVTYKNDSVFLTKKEYDLLLYLIRNKNKVIAREKILNAVWEYDFIGNTNVVDVYIRYLRQKIDDKYDAKLIETVRGSGYIVRDPFRREEGFAEDGVSEKEA